MLQQSPLAGKRALVTGASKRLGRAVSLALAAEGVHVAVHYRNSEAEARQLAAEIIEHGVESWLFQADLRRTDQTDALFSSAQNEAGSIDILVNNAAIFPSDTLNSVNETSIESNIRINAVAPVLLSKRFTEQNREGAILHFLDARVLDYDKEHVSYHLSKRMLYSLTRIMAIEYAPRVRVNAVAPGLVLPPEGKDEGYLRELAHTNPLGAHGTAKDVTDAALFLIKSRFITGQVIFVDGGRHLKGSVYG